MNSNALNACWNVTVCVAFIHEHVYACLENECKKGEWGWEREKFFLFKLRRDANVLKLMLWLVVVPKKNSTYENMQNTHHKKFNRGVKTSFQHT